MTTPRKKCTPTPEELALDIRILDPQIGTLDYFPRYGSAGAAGLDLRAMMAAQSLIVRPGEVHLIPTGIAIHINDPNLAALVIPRSGLGHTHGIIMGNGTGLIDSDYTGQVFVSVWNRSDVPYKIVRGDRIAQLVVLPVARVKWRVVEEFATTARGANGFGSTGTV